MLRSLLRPHRPLLIGNQPLKCTIGECNPRTISQLQELASIMGCNFILKNHNSYPSYFTRVRLTAALGTVVRYGLFLKETLFPIWLARVLLGSGSFIARILTLPFPKNKIA
ncbi:hypothetical protein L1887_37953 [Cichorium endivia]|nr:hypothetical protein L1887_37953 [Cichorium endivia]